MYPVPDDDLELLECYLDDALSDDEISHLRSRLAIEPEMAAALRMLRDERAQREAYFQAIEPTPAEVEAIVASVHASANRKRWWQDSRRLARAGSAVAACLAIALVGGFFYHASGKSPLHDDGTPGSTAPGQVTPVGYPVEVRDADGHLLGVQHFDNPRDADEFHNDVMKMQERGRQSNVVIFKTNDF